MKLHLISDLHLETHIDYGLGFIKSLDPDQTDVLIIAGDLADSETVHRSLVDICLKYAPKPVLYVLGNHEFYHGSQHKTSVKVKSAQALCPNLHWLNRTVLELEGKRFIGATGWYNPPNLHWSDFVYIKDAPHFWIREAYLADKGFFEKTVKEGDIVISHMLPSVECVAPRWEKHPDNGFFVCEMTDLILSAKPAYWLFGHTHDWVDKIVGSTRTICAPRGYASDVVVEHANGVIFEV